VITVAEVAVQLSELTSSSVFAFFSLVLTAAGVFLIAEFALDSVSATVQFRARHPGLGLEHRGVHLHSIYRYLAPLTAAAMFAMILLGFLTNAMLLYVSAGLLVPAIYFVYRADQATGLGRPVDPEPRTAL